MQWGIDVNAARFINGARETLNGDGDVAPEELKHLYTDQGCTLQVHQPQRWDATIHRIVAALESKFGCLIGCNSYITPENTQGLAPHYDDVDVFVCQTSGTKRWFVYNVEAGGPAGHLTTKSSPDLDVDNLPKKPLLDVELSPGDVLYMPRGTVHQAQANQGGSSHLTLSAYQRWNFATLATTLLACMAENAPMGMQHDNPCVLPEDLRRGLPVGWLYNAGLQVCLTMQYSSTLLLKQTEFHDLFLLQNLIRLRWRAQREVQPRRLQLRLGASARKRAPKRAPMRASPPLVMVPRQPPLGLLQGCGRWLRQWSHSLSCSMWQQTPWRLTCGSTVRPPIQNSSATR